MLASCILTWCFFRKQSLRTTGGFAYLERKTDGPANIRIRRKARSLRMQYFRHFIYVNLGILVALYKNVLFECTV